MIVTQVLSKVWALITAICMILTGFIDFGEATVTPSTLEIVKTDKVLLEKAMYTGQGITTDGEYYYTSGSMTALKMTGLAKWKADDFTLEMSNLDVIPKEYKDKYESNHVGGISYYNGLIYAGVENKGKDHPLVVTYDCETLEKVSVYEISNEILPNGIPWCAVDADNGYLYCSPFRDVEKIAAFDIDTMQFSHYIVLSQGITRIQGGEVYQGKLYLSSDNGENTDTVYTVDVISGDTQVFCERTAPGLAGNEAEDMTVFPMSDGSFVHIIDYDKTVGIYIRHYGVKG